MTQVMFSWSEASCQFKRSIFDTIHTTTDRGSTTTKIPTTTIFSALAEAAATAISAKKAVIRRGYIKSQVATIQHSFYSPL